MAHIVFKDFYCYYKIKKEYVTALDKISLEISDGQFVAVIGESGGGKTTFLKCILGLCDYIDGELTVNGVPIDKLDMKSGLFAYVKQEIALYPNMTIYENIAFPLRAIHTDDDEIEKRVSEIAAQTGLEWLLTRKPKQLSWGQQRVAIARALIKHPEIALMDELFANLDTQNRESLLRLIKKMHTVYGMTTIFVTHDLHEAFFLADRVVVLEKGRVIDDGTPDELVKNCRSELLKKYFKGAL